MDQQRSKFITTIVGIFGLALVPQIGFAKTSATPSPYTYTGSPLDKQSCNACHGTNNKASSNISLSGFPAQWQPNTTYTLTLSFLAGSANYGFEITAENGSAKQGSFTAGTNSVAQGTGAHYLSHKNASSVKSWTFQYTTPAAGAGTITLYVIGAASQSTNYLNSFPMTESTTPVPPTVTTQPTNQAIGEGQTATFTIAASGSSPLSYQWQKAPPASASFANISGATLTSYTTPTAVLLDSGSQFRCVVTNSAGSATSNAATLTVQATPPTITQQPTNQNVTTGQTATFSVSAAGSSPLSYQWQSAPVGNPTFTNIPSATLSSYTTPATTLPDNGTQFRCIITNTAGSVTSSVATLTVGSSATAPSITQQPANQSVTEGQTATFTVGANGTSPLTYKWQKAPSGSPTFSDIPGASAAAYVTPATLVTDNGAQFRCVVTNSIGNVTTNIATLTVNTVVTPPAVTSDPADQNVTAGQAATFVVTASGSAPLSFQWWKAPPNSATFSKVTGATNASYTTPATTANDNGAQFQCVISNAGGSVTSAAATLYVVASQSGAPVILTQPANITLSPGQTATFVVSASGAQPITYQWYRDSIAIAGATDSMLTLPSIASTDSGAHFVCLLQNGSGSVMSQNATLTVADLSVPIPELVSPVTSITGNGALSIKTRYLSLQQFNWTFDGPIHTTSVQTGYSINLSNLHLNPGLYHVTVAAQLLNGAVSAPLQVDITVTSASLGKVIANPNPWRVDRDQNRGITFENLTANSTVKILTIKGDLVKTLFASKDSAVWDLTSNNGTKVVSGLYIYLVSDSEGHHFRSKVVVLR